jgi:hypothetical protein
VSVFVDAPHLGLLIGMTGMAAVRVVMLTKSIKEENFGGAKIWGMVFGTTSLAAAWSFWRLV